MSASYDDDDDENEDDDEATRVRWSFPAARRAVSFPHPNILRRGRRRSSSPSSSTGPPPPPKRAYGERTFALGTAETTLSCEAAVVAAPPRAPTAPPGPVEAPTPEQASASPPESPAVYAAPVPASPRGSRALRRASILAVAVAAFVATFAGLAFLGY